MVQEKKYDGAKANLQAAKLRLEAYRGLIGTEEAKPAADLENEIEKISVELEKPGVADRIRGMWDTTPATARMAMNAAANFAMRDCSASILPLMRAHAPLSRLSSASNTAVAFGMTAAPRQFQRSRGVRGK